MEQEKQSNMANYNEASTSKSICFAVTKHAKDVTKEEEEDLYIQKVQELANEKLELFARVKEEIKETYKSKKRPTTTSVDVDHHVKKKKLKSESKEVNCKVLLPVVHNEVTKRLKEFITNEMNGSDIHLVIQKRLFSSDVSRNHNRLNMPIKQLMTTDFLREEEKRFLAISKENEIKVPLVGPKLRTYEQLMGFKTWRMVSTKNYVLKTNWFKFLEENKHDLKKGELIQVWSFRINNQLCFAVACVNKPMANMTLSHEEGSSSI